MDLDALAIFAKVAAAGSFSEAARRAGMPVSTVSRRVALLEEDLGARLIERSTRRLRLTETGLEVLEQARRAADIGDAVGDIVARRMGAMGGLLRLSAPPSISDTLLEPLIRAFQLLHPQVRFEVLIADRGVDGLAEGIAFRVGAPEDPAPRASGLVARRLLRYRHQLVASPAYLAAHPAPTRPGELAGHRLLAFSHRRPTNRWAFLRHDGGPNETVEFTPALAMNDFAGLVPALEAGLGIGVLPPIVQPQLMREGRLVEVMTQWRFRSLDLALVHPAAGPLPRTVRAFTEFAAEAAPKLFPSLPN